MTSAEDKLITIVIPVYNRAAVVMNTLESIAGQDTSAFKLVLVDNNSTDSTLSVLESWAASHPEIEVKIERETMPGASAARNRGLAEVNTPYVMFFDSDDLMLRGHAARVVQALRDNPGVDIVGWNIERVWLDGSRSVKNFYSRDLLFHNILHGALGTQRYCARTELVRRSGGWNPADRGWDDIEMGTRMLVNGRVSVAKIGGRPPVRVLSQVDSITGVKFSDGAERFDASVDRIAATLPEKKRHWAELKRVILAADCYKEGRRDLAEKLLEKSLGRTASASRRLMLRFAYRYTCMGLRGVATLLRVVL